MGDLASSQHWAQGLACSGGVLSQRQLLGGLGSVRHRAGEGTPSVGIREGFLEEAVSEWFFFFLFFFNVYLFLGQRQSMNGGGAEREGDTESEAGSRLRAISPEPDAGLELTDHEIVT